jgi:hypothetical protein
MFKEIIERPNFLKELALTRILSFYNLKFYKGINLKYYVGLVLTFIVILIKTSS